jgi:hypothetical protein
MNWPLVGVARMTMAYVCHLFAYKLFVFLRFDYANLLKLASAGQLKKTVDMICHAAARVGQTDRTTTQIIFGP